MLKRTAFFAAMLLLAATGRAGAQEADSSCLALSEEYLNRVCPMGAGNYWQKSDSCFIDTCSLLGAPCDIWDSLYAKRDFVIQFDSDVFMLPAYPVDSNILMRWTQLDTSFHSLRAMFDSIQQQWGNFVLAKSDPNRTNPSPLAGEYLMYFDSYANVFSVTSTLTNDSISNFYSGGPYGVTGSGGVNVPSTNGSQAIRFLPNPVHSTISITMKDMMASAVDVFNVLGELARHYDLPGLTGSFMIDLTGLPAGVYSIKCANQIFRIVFEP